MKAVFKQVQAEMNFENTRIYTLAIENKKLLRNLILSFENGTSEDYLVFSDKDTPFEFSAKGMFISNPLCLNLDNKKLLTKINTFLEQESREYYSENLIQIKTSLNDLGNLLAEKLDFTFEFNGDIDTSSIIKLLSFKISKGTDTELDLLGRYIISLATYLNIKLFAIPYLHSFYSDEELEELFKTLSLNEINVLCLDYVTPKSRSKYETLQIIDSDLCCIDNRTFL